MHYDKPLDFLFNHNPKNWESPDLSDYRRKLVIDGMCSVNSDQRRISFLLFRHHFRWRDEEEGKSYRIKRYELDGSKIHFEEVKKKGSE